MGCSRVLLTYFALYFLAIAYTASEEIGRCEVGVLDQLTAQCTLNGSSSNTADAIKLAFQQYRQCLIRPLRVLAPTSFASWLTRSASQFEQQIGVPVNVTYTDYFRLPSLVELQLSGLVQQDLWIVDGASIPPLAQSNSLRVLDDLLRSNSAVEWSDVHPLWASLSAAANKTVAMPVDSDVLLLYYRRDVFDAWNMSVPSTWDELAALAAFWNAQAHSSTPPAPPPPAAGPVVANASSAQARPQPRYGLCLNDASYCTSGAILSAILASMTQRFGPRTGWALALDLKDPDQATGLVNGTAMAAALATYKALAAHSPSKLVCQQTLFMFAAGQCLMTVNWGRQFKALQQASPVRGAVGITLTPGSARVLDRSKGVLVPAGAQTCRSPARTANGSWVCRAPMLAYGGTFGVIGSRNDATYQERAFLFLTYLLSSTTQWDGVLDPSSPVEPVRTSMMQQEAALRLEGLGSLVGFGGFDRSDAQAYLAALREAFSHPNVALEFGAPGSLALRYGIEVALQTYLAGAPAETVANELLRSWLQEWASRGFTVAQVQDMLLRATPDPAAEAETPSTAAYTKKVLGWPIGAGALSACVLLTALFSTVFWLKQRRARRALLRRIVAPLSGAETTLVVTDIQDSTKMWETLHSDVMDASIYYHHSLARKLMLRFQGYESATEGDSFIIAFQTADDAVCFCASFQQELLLVAWPEELLALDGCRAIYMATCKSEPPAKRKTPPNPQLEVARTQGPLISSQQGSMGRSAPSITPNPSEQGTSVVAGPAGSANHAASLRVAKQPSGNLSLTYGGMALPNGASPFSGATPESPVLPPSLPSATTHGLPPRHLRTVASFAAPSSGQGSMGALGASPRQLSFLGRSVSRLGMQHSVPASGLLPSTSGILAPGAGGSTERNQGRSSTISISGGFSMSGNVQPAVRAALDSPQQHTAPDDGAAVTAGAAAVGIAAADAKAAFATASVMSFRESFREGPGVGEALPRRISEAGSAASGRHTVDGTTATRVPTLTGYQSTPAVVPSPSVDGAGTASGAVGTRSPVVGGRRDRSPALSRRSLQRSGSPAVSHRRVCSGAGGILSEPTSPFGMPDTLDANGGGSEVPDRPTHNSRQSRSTTTDMASVSEFNTILESGGHHYVRCSDMEGPLSPTDLSRGIRAYSRPALPALNRSPSHPTVNVESGDADQELTVTPQLLGKILSSNISSAMREGSIGTGAASAAHSSPAGSGAGSAGGSASGAVSGGGAVPSPCAALGSLGPLAEGVPAEQPSMPAYSPRAAARRGSVTFDFHPGANGSSGDEQYGYAGPGLATTPVASLPGGVVRLRYNSQSQSSPQLVMNGTGAAPGSSDEQGLSNSNSQQFYTASNGSSRPSPTTYARAPSHLRASTTGATAGVPLGARGASLRRRSDTMSLASGPGFSDLSAYHAPHGHDGALRPSPLGRDTSHKVVSTGGLVARGRGANSGGGASDSGRPVAVGPGSTKASTHEHSGEVSNPSTRGQSSPLPLVSASHPLSEDGTGRGVGPGSTNIEPPGGDGIPSPEIAVNAATSPIPIPENSTILQRHGSLVFPVKRSLTQTLPVRTPNASGGGAGAQQLMGAAMRGVASTNSTAGRGMFGLLSFPTQRHGGGAGAGLLGMGMGMGHAHVPDSRAASMASMMRLASQHNLQSVGDSLCSRWRVLDELEPGAQLMFRGLRVRMGVHSGLTGETDAVQLNRTANRMQYMGLGIQMAKAVCDCAHGAQVLMTEAAFTQLAVESLKERVMVLHMGEHRMKEELPTCAIYLACPRSLQGRLPALRSVRSSQQHSLGVLEAPAGQVVVVFMHVVGAMSLLDWRPDLAHTALAMFRDHVILELIKYQGYLVEAVDGLVLASFSSPASGLRWAVKCQHDMTMLPWPQELLSHEACEELCISRPNPVSGQQEEVVLFRGLRLKAGVDMGRLRGEINCITGRMSYRGRAMNRAARIVAAAGSGQVLASSDVWNASSTQATAHMCGLTATSMGQFNLKGVSEPLELFRIKTSLEIISKRTKAMLSSQEDPLELDELPIADPAAALQHHANINNAASAAAAAAAAAVTQQHGGSAGAVCSPQALRSASTSAVGNGGAASGLPQRLLLERMHSMSGGLAAALRREESMSRGGKMSLSRQLSRNISMRSRRSSRRSSVGSQYSQLAANTILNVARGSMDGVRQDVSSPARSGAVGHVPGPGVALPPGVGGTMSTQASISLSVPGHGPGVGIPPALLSAGSHINTLGSVGSHGYHLPYGVASVGSGTRTSRNSTAGEHADTDGARSSNQRSSNPSNRNSGGLMPLLSRASHAGTHLAAIADGTSSVPLRPGPGPRLVRHLSTLIRSASMAVYGTSAPHAAAGPGGYAAASPVGMQSLQAHPAVAVALSPTPEAGYEEGNPVQQRSSGDRRGRRRSVHRDTTFTASSAAAMGLPVSGSPPAAGAQGHAGPGSSGGNALRDMLPPRLRAAGALFRVGSFSGHVRRRVDDNTHASDFGDSGSVRGGRSPPGARRMASTMTGIGYVTGTAPTTSSTTGLASPPAAARKGVFRRRSSGDPMRPRSAATEHGSTVGRRSRAEGLGGVAEAPEAGEDSFVIVVGDADNDGESEEPEDGQAAEAEPSHVMPQSTSHSLGGFGGGNSGGPGGSSGQQSVGAGGSAGHSGATASPAAAALQDAVSSADAPAVQPTAARMRGLGLGFLR